MYGRHRTQGVPGVSIKSFIVFGVTGVSPWITIRPSLGPLRIKLGKKTFRIPISLTEGSCFQIKARDPRMKGIGMGMGIGIGPGRGLTLAREFKPRIPFTDSIC